MLYRAYQSWSDLFAPARAMARAALASEDAWTGMPTARRLFALAHLVADTGFTHERPDFRISAVLSGNRMIGIHEEAVLDLPFCTLRRFVREDDGDKPKMLLVVPLSGHFATLLRSTIETLLRDHDVYVTDWKNARDVPLAEGGFGFDDYVDYVIRCLETLGPGASVMAVCQPCVQTLVAVATMAADGNPAQPRTMTLMGGPVDTRIAPTVVNDLATAHPIEWFRDKLIATVPGRYPGRGRRVYPGFLQLSAFMSMNTARHTAQFRALYQAIADGETADAETIESFYAEYFAVLDLDAQFYLETVDRVFQRALLAKRELDYRGRRVDCGAIRRTALLTVEGERDDICAVGQTAAAHDLCSSLRPHLKRHHLQPGVGHYGVFSGSKWERQIYPQVKSLVLAMA